VVTPLGVLLLIIFRGDPGLDTKTSRIAGKRVNVLNIGIMKGFFGLVKKRLKGIGGDEQAKYL
jgi:hypothetical protein